MNWEFVIPASVKCRFKRRLLNMSAPKHIQIENMYINSMTFEQDKHYVLLGKTAKNEWLPISLIYPELDRNTYSFESLAEAQSAKRDLKNYLKVYRVGHKVPLRIALIDSTP